MPPLTHLPASAKSCSRRSYSTYRLCKRIYTGDHDVQEDFYTRPGAHPAIPFGNIESSLIQPICHPKGICCKSKLKEHDPAHTLLQQCVPMHFRF
ncbi:hypothetical protein [Absidia glauca]|uniref:Ndc10 domain-containing protein n=1 Tax=Absidia glauca TaxID=4829 RepID=A0A168KRJ6_ABSGL|nr:hypothetical protein [Absidia glauca]